MLAHSRSLDEPPAVIFFCIVTSRSRPLERPANSACRWDCTQVGHCGRHAAGTAVERAVCARSGAHVAIHQRDRSSL